MAGDLSGATTMFSNISVGGRDANGNAFGSVWVGSEISAPSLNVTTSKITATSSVSTPQLTGSTVTVQTSLGMPSTATTDFAGSNVLSWRTLPVSSLTASAGNTNIRDREVVFLAGGASGVSLALYSNGTIYIFNSALSAKAT